METIESLKNKAIESLCGLVKHDLGWLCDNLEHELLEIEWKSDETIKFLYAIIGGVYKKMGMQTFSVKELVECYFDVIGCLRNIGPLEAESIFIISFVRHYRQELPTKSFAGIFKDTLERYNHGKLDRT